MMTQGVLPFQYVRDKTVSHLTAFAGLPLYLDLALISGLCAGIAEQLTLKKQGWSDLQLVMALVLLNLAGGDCVEDIYRLEQDEGLSRLLRYAQTDRVKPEPQVQKQRWRKRQSRAFPAPAAIYRYLGRFHQPTEEKKRVPGTAFIPAANEALQTLVGLQKPLLDFAQQQTPCQTATLDQDATLVATHKKTAWYCYEKYLAYQPLNTYWHEQGLLLHSEFRDGNVPAGFEQCRVLQEALAQLPVGVETVLLRSDTAGYQQALLQYCAEGQHTRFGIIEFAIGANVTPAFKQAVKELPETAWQPLISRDGISTAQQWAEVGFVPHWVGYSKQGVPYRYLAIRERMTMPPHPSVLSELPFPTLAISASTYKVFGVVTNRTIPGNDLINWYRERCGDSEKVHAVEKSELAGGQLPSQKFGANAAWWQIMLLAFNLNTLMKRLALPEVLKTKALKGLRFQVILRVGKVIQHARGLVIKLSGGLAVAQQMRQIHERIKALAQAPPLLSAA